MSWTWIAYNYFIY